MCAEGGHWLYVMRVDLQSLGEGRQRLTASFTNGARGKWDGWPHDVRPCHDALLAAMTDETAIDVSAFPSLRIGSGFEHDW